MPRDVLIVEDQGPELRIYGNSVQLRLNIEPFLAENPEQALEILRDYTIKVLVVDYNLESSMNGVDLVKKVQDELGLQIPCILITGQKDSVSLGEAVGRFFRFIDKADVAADLMDAIRDALSKYKLDQRFRLSFPVNQVLAEHRSTFRFNTRVSITLTRVNNIDETYVKEDDWETFENVLQNITQAYEKEVRSKAAFTHSYGVTSTLTQKLDLSVGKLLGGLKSVTEGKLSIEEKLEESQELEVKIVRRIQTTALSGRADPDGRVLKSIEFQAAPVYVRVDGIVEVQCNCCQVPRRDDATFLIPTARVALRQVEHYDGAPDHIVTGGTLAGSLI